MQLNADKVTDYILCTQLFSREMCDRIVSACQRFAAAFVDITAAQCGSKLQLARTDSLQNVASLLSQFMVVMA